MRIPEHVIEQINEEVSLVRLAEAAGVELRPDGEALIGPCPFHPDEGSSLMVSLGENTLRCTGDCEAGGSVIEWTMRAEGVSFSHAVELLREGSLPSAPDPRRAARSTARKLDSPIPAGIEERKLLDRVVDFYAQTLRDDPQALSYLERRGLRDPELLERFRLGCANRTLGYRLPEKKPQGRRGAARQAAKAGRLSRLRA